MFKMPLKIAMWSGPRNISTAMMRSWENRHDCEVIDEPFYAYYLKQTQSPHPCFEEILASQSTQYDEVAKQLIQNQTAAIQYQKHMTHHMLQNVDLKWTQHLQHCFLIRDPHEIVNSYTNSRGKCTAEDIGIIRQAQLYEKITALTSQEIPVIDSNAVLNNPSLVITKMCEALSIDFQENMLSWPKGRRKSDGVWAKHWYHSVEASSGFAKISKKSFNLTKTQLEVVEEVMPYYNQMKAHTIC
jgi:hypothetical protein